MDENHLLNALAYVSLNPVRAGLVKRAQDWKRSSVNAHLAGQSNGITEIAPALSRIASFNAMLDDEYGMSKFESLCKAEVTDRSIGDGVFITSLEKQFERTLKPVKRGLKPDMDRSF